MQEPKILLTMLNRMGEKPEIQFDKLYQKLYNPKLWWYAYERSYAKPGNMTPGVNGRNIDGMSDELVAEMISRLKASSYKPMPVRRIYRPKANGKLRPLGIPCFEDKLLQSAVRLILEAIYEPQFLDVSHGFRPGRSCHSALKSVMRMNGTRWWVEGDIRGCFDNIDHEVMLSILRKRIRDERFLHLIRQFLTAGYVENWEYHRTFSGTPQGGNLSPVLSNIYLHEMDTALQGYQEAFDKGEVRAKSGEWKRVLNRRYRARKQAQVTGEWSEYRKLGNQLRTMQAMNERDADFRRLYYVRYADDFLIGINGSKRDAEAVQGWLSDFLRDRLKLELSEEKTLITNSKDPVRFLGYDIKRWPTGYARKKQANGRTVIQRVSTHNLALLMPQDKVISFVRRYGNPQGWQGQARPQLFLGSELETLLIHNSELNGFLNYYSLAHNLTAIGDNILYMASTSFFKTLAGKRRSTVKKVAKSLKRGPGDYRVSIRLQNGEQRDYRLLASTRQLKKERIDWSKLDVMSNTVKYFDITELGQRIRAQQCEWCGTTEGSIQVHHIRRLKDLKGKAEWEKVMLARRRKTLVLCLNCHHKLHAGTLQPIQKS